jgi:HEAT repeat protein
MCQSDPIEAARGHVAGLARRLAAGEADERAAAAEALCHMGAEAAPAVLALVTACGDDDERVREWAVAALEEIGPPPAAAIPGLVVAAESTLPLAAYWAITLLGRAQEAAGAAVAVLADRVERAGDVAVRERAAWALGRIGPAAAEAREALKSAMEPTGSRLSRLAREALAAIDGPATG